MNNRASIEEVLNVHFFILSSCHRVIYIIVVNLLIASNTYVTKGWGHSRSLRGLLQKINWARIANRSGKVCKMFLLRILLKQNTALLSTVRPSVTSVTSLISHIYKRINAILIIRGPIKPYTFWIEIILAIFLAKTRPDPTIFSARTNLTIEFDWSKNLSKI